METSRLVIIGGGGHCGAVYDVVAQINTTNRANNQPPAFEVLGVLADGGVDEGLLERRGLPYLGGVSKLADLPDDVGYVIAIGSGKARRDIDEFGQRLGRPCPVLVHPHTTFGFDVQLGPGSVVVQRSMLQSDVRTGRHVHINGATGIGHGVVIGDYATIGPMVIVAGDASIGEEATLGIGAIVTEEVNIGSGAIVGSGGVVESDVSPNCLAVSVWRHAETRLTPQA